MKTNERASTLRNRMIRLLQTISDLKSRATRKRVTYEVCYNELSRKVFDALLSDELLRDAVVVELHRRKNRRAGRSLKGRKKRVHRQFAKGRPGRIYKLTRTGRVVLKRLIREQEADRAALTLARDQAAQAREATRQARAEAKIKREAMETARKAARIAKDLARRTAGFELSVAPPERYIAPYCPPAPAPAPAVQRPLPAGFSAPPPAPWGTAQARPTAPAIGASSLIDKIRKAGYRVNDRGEVLYDNKWTPLEIWRQKMSHVNLD